MIDLKALRDNPERFKEGASAKNVDIDIDHLLVLDQRKRVIQHEREEARSEQNALAKKTGPEIGRLSKQLKGADDAARPALQQQIEALKAAPAALKTKIAELDTELEAITPELEALLLAIPQPPDADVPRGASGDDNVEISRWSPDAFDPARGKEVAGKVDPGIVLGEGTQRRDKDGRALVQVYFNMLPIVYGIGFYIF
jgi:seryl-tRNA synthetase